MQLSLFDWRPPPPPRAVRRDVAERAMDVALHERPDPRRVYALSVSHGYEAAAERWWWCSKSDLSRLISQGRALAVGTRSERVRRSLTLADEQRVVDAVLELGGDPVRRRGHGRAREHGPADPARTRGRLPARLGPPPGRRSRPAAPRRLRRQEGRMTDLTFDDVRARLSAAIREAGSQKAFAHKAGVSAGFLSDVVHGRRDPGERVLAAIDLRRVERFVSLRGDA
ncbi:MULTISPECIES: helix-turn-helix domain-containing protein [Methylorubrum]|uniref:Uncharacterized protein n=3 Tax=Methylorubrum TaxID=2282523 RepID=C5B1U8_METEA|nr:MULTISPECIES: helix-turn-helix transcriptional regulator [Methylorubrum]ACS39732.1 Hypothetical protein MexAM1_META1p1920 [Methylorubrum extorquens AM1]MCP1542127.1 hypothetical protein [Methylorubrum extorquens]MCP1590528.1 hypothetical protein [Methylorubrum extorquens]